MCTCEIQAVSLIEIERQMLFYFLQSSRSWRWRYQRQARLVLPWKCFCGSNARWRPWWHSLHEMRKLNFCRSLSPWVLITLLLSNVLPWNLSTPVLLVCSDHLAVTFGIVDVASEGRHKAIHRSEDMTCGYDDILYVCVRNLRIKVALLFPFWPLDLVVAFHTLHLRLGIVILMKL